MQSDTLAPGTLVAGRYKIVRELGRGGMGAVYVVEHINTGGLWALKVMLNCTRLQAERASRFRREARASARITSEHVVKVTDADTAPELEGAPFIVMELLDGQDVERLLEKREGQRLEAKETLDILSQVARGLDKAHAAGVIHRDLKPENIFVHKREDGSTIVKVLDFGISKVLRPDGDMASASVTGASDVMGTPLYMAPEQATARHDQVGPATDVWAVGLMAVRMLAGSVYWKGDTIAEVFVQIMSETRWPPSSRWPELGPDFDAWFSKSCAPRVADRFQSVGEQIAELSVILTGERPPVRSTAPGVRLPTDSSGPPQLRTQIMQASDKSSARPMAAVGVSTAEPVTSTAIPLNKPARGLAIGGAVAVIGLLAFGGMSVLRSGDDTSAASRATTPAASRDPSAATVLGTGAPGAPGAQAVTSPPAPQPVAAADAGVTTITTVASPVTLTPPAEPTAPAAVAAREGSRAVKSSAPPAPPPALVAAPANPVRPVGAAAAPPPAAPPATSAAPAKPAPKPADLFDTQK